MLARAHVLIFAFFISLSVGERIFTINTMLQLGLVTVLLVMVAWLHTAAYHGNTRAAGRAQWKLYNYQHEPPGRVSK